VLIKTLAAVAATAWFAAGTFAQSNVVNLENEPAPGLTVQPPLPGPLAQGVVFIPYRLENGEEQRLHLPIRSRTE
jgi:hypothetical protein